MRSRIKSVYLPRGYWEDIQNRKRFFTEFAKKSSFEVADGRAWRNVTMAQIATEKVSFILLSLFPHRLHTKPDYGTNVGSKVSSKQVFMVFANCLRTHVPRTQLWLLQTKRFAHLLHA